MDSDSPKEPVIPVEPAKPESSEADVPVEDVPSSNRTDPTRFVVLSTVAIIIFFGGFLTAWFVKPSGPTQVAGASTVEIPNATFDEFNAILVNNRGKAVVVNFWASWCGPCRREAPAFQRVHDEMKDAGVVMVGVNSGDTKPGAVGFLEEFGITYMNVVDNTNVIADSYRVQGLPTTFFFDKEGNVADTAVGTITESDLRARIAAIVGS